jgi:hypothetical protein
MAEPTIKRGEEHFFPIIYEGTGGGQKVGNFVPFTDSGTVANSCTFDRTSTRALIRTPSSDGNKGVFTISFWYKPGGKNYGIFLYASGVDDAWNSPNSAGLYHDNYKLKFYSSGTTIFESARTLEDTSKWYHILIANDSSQSGTDKIKLYIDGEQQTSFTMDSRSSVPTNSIINTQIKHNIGGQTTTGTTNAFIDASFAEYNFVDGTALTPATFGETDTSTGRWVPKTLTGITYGTNGFRLQFLDSTHAGIDTSGNGNTFTAQNLIGIESQPIAMGGTAFNTGSTGSWDSSYPVANGFTKNTSTQAIYDHGSTAIGGIIGWDFGSGRSANIQHIKINQIAANNSITGFAFEYSDNGSDYTSVGTFSVSASASEQTVSVLNTAGKHRYWRLRATTDTSGGQSSYRWIVAFLGFFPESVPTDSPTQNFVTFDPLDSGNNAGATPGTAVLAEGNTRIIAGSNPSNWDQYRTNKPLSSGKFYCEVTLTSLNTATYFGVISRHQNIKGGGWYSDQKTGWSYDSANGKTENSNNGYISYGGARSQGDVVGIAVDLDNGKLWFSENGTYPNSGNPATGANPAYSNLKIAVQDGGLCFTEARGYSGHNDWNFGQRAFRYTPPTDFVAVQQDNMAETSKGVSGLVWIKDRDASRNHNLFDSSRGIQKELRSNSTDEEFTNTDTLQKFLKGGFSIEDGTSVNNSGNSYVSWNWVANGGTTSSNGNGSITSTTQVNSTAGFSIVTYTGTGSNATVGHGLSSAPECFMVKELGNANAWVVSHKGMTNQTGYSMILNTTAGEVSASTVWNSTAPTSSVFSIGTDTALNRDGGTYVAYCWHGVDGYSKFGKYTGSSNANGTFVYTGFKPSFVLIKSTSTQYWMIQDSARWKFNPTDKPLFPANPDGESDLGAQNMDLLSNGFKCRSTSDTQNDSSHTYIYMAFAEHPFVGDGTNPVTAR